MSKLVAHLRLSAVILAVPGDVPRVLTVEAAPGPVRLPADDLDLAGDETLELGLRRLVRDQTELELGYVEQLYTFGDRRRDPRAFGRGARTVSVAYLALAREEANPPAEGAAWRDCYGLLPWEDRRTGVPPEIRGAVEAALAAWSGGSSARAERADIAFGLGGAAWDDERVLQRYELLYEVGLAAERSAALPAAAQLGQAMHLDDRRILATAMGRVRAKIKYRPVVFELLPATFTLLRLQRVVEALAGVRLHKGNFRRFVARAGLVEGTGEMDADTGGRPAELFRFRRDVLRERRAPGVGLPAATGPE